VSGPTFAGILGRSHSEVNTRELPGKTHVPQGDELEPETMSRPEKRSEPTEETQEESAAWKQFTRLGSADRT